VKEGVASRGAVESQGVEPKALRALESSCAKMVERLREQLEAEPGRHPTIASVKSIQVRVGSVGATRSVGSLCEMGVSSHGVELRLHDQSLAPELQRALKVAQLQARWEEGSSHISVSSSAYLGQRLSARATRLAMAAREGMREARRKARRDHPQEDWSKGSKASMDAARVLASFEQAACELRDHALHRR
jgi:hypothetical protein